ncbi:AgmX/PglI C-terminal domain-containing protein [Polyangium jinanense]|uniref:AgmX/PglI C-terminal domain-containing protein n=1 Tax=Polyangium jinanense TaxID=2829994 RepID=A0A9X4AT26_9BACT|nr:AgmX/PglI C-terminal domain-containing protein [Polyangium jinanense]MDC3958586.1 AgmX/PglI C-terminal domain-containing protein [Polyangium jinanense]MDC3983106.1 AgmX/PglI C-terminal domain-containing protein [Polyangium jinanense]
MLRVLWPSSLALLLVGCAGATPPPDAPPNPEAKAPPAEAPPAPEAKAEPPNKETNVIGALDAPVGKLEPAEIQKVIRGNFKALRACYEEGLQKTPNLEGRIAVKFVIGKDGKVSQAAEDSPATLPDPDVVKCVIAAVETLTFPAPEGGVVKVVYPIMFSPGGGDAMSNCKKTAEEKDGIRTVSIVCDKQTLKVTDMPVRAVDEKFADAILTGFEQQSPKMRRTRGKPTIADKPGWSTLVDGQTWVSTLLVTEVTKGRALVVSCLDETGGTSSGRCDTLVEFIVKREATAGTTPSPSPTPKRPLPTGTATGSGF